MLQLKRFDASGQKVSKYVSYPLVLDVTKYCTAAAITRVQHRGSGKDIVRSSRELYKYELNAICVHDGKSLHFGHYYAIVKAANGTWYMCNDTYVSPMSEEKVLNMQAYMLFYSRILPDSNHNNTDTHGNCALQSVAVH
uniref:Ubiquitin carboxyl-terminal hydrolase 36 n=1 Tax=Lygus hesperus TaxID=30085 RepID=A0A0A9YMI5_LYGHE